MPEHDDDPVQILGLLAEPERLRVAAAIVLGHATVDDIARLTGLTHREVERSLARLNGGGLIEHVAGAGFRFVVERLKVSARNAASQHVDEFDAPPEQARVLRSFFKAGKLASIPAVQSKRLVVLDHIVQDFEPGRTYPERQVNDMLRTYHDDVASLRRYLVDEGFLARDRGRYWRAGGTFSID